ncbi:helix-turn-helix domain-containing protein [Roseibium litorale]|uniref:Helix-turn-helix domain-containing protein n=1 Tax=Roseibium litorale TaxID=2803841 RepID=A0ABR9CJ98_9HYPH|nr:helix-turn-helix domain-containing protein [Roseibium litorale]MBD8890916.1 helix-turn-helix domain-containing protein [Roseibium litorale]
MKPYLPGILMEIAEIVGEGNALAIAKEKGGGRCHFPAAPAPDHWLSMLIGHSSACKLCQELAIGTASGNRLRGIYVDVPLGPSGSRAETHRQIDKLHRSGKSQEQIARECGVSRRTVQRRLGDHMSDDPDRRQPSLFDLPKAG